MQNLLNLKSFFKFLSKNKGYSFVDIFGLSVSLMFVILIAVYTWQGLSTDNFQTKADRIYALGTEDVIGSAWRIGERVAENYPEIEAMCPVVSFFQRTATIDENAYTFVATLASANFFQFFDFKLVQGDKETVLATKDYAVISESFARRVFSDRDPLGQTIILNDSVRVVVNGIMKDLKQSTIPETDILIHIDNVKFFNKTLDSPTGNNALGCQVFLLAHENADLPAKEEEIAEFLKEFFWFYQRGIADKVVLTPLKELYFSSKPNYTGLNRGDWSFIMVLMSIGILILLFAVINYINLTVAQTGQRAKEMATRRLLGSSRQEIFSRLILESTILSIVSFLIGLLLAYAVLPFADDLVETKINLTDAFTPVNISISILVVLVLGLIAGILPAIIISNSKPIDVVRGGFRRKTKMVFSKVFITFQNTITIMLLVASITMYLQINHMINAPLGYNSTDIIRITTQHFNSEERMFTIGNEISQLASVEQVAYGAGTPFDQGNNSTVEYEDRNISFQMLTGDSAYFSIHGFDIIRENHITSPDGYYLNQQAFRELMIAEDAPSFKLYDEEVLISGMIRDFQMGNILDNIPPTLLRLRKHDQFYPWNILIKVKGDSDLAYGQIKERYEQLMELEFPGQFITQKIEDSFRSQRRIAKITVVFAVIAIIISLLGLLAMSTYFIQQRSREIAVRKVFGSHNFAVLKSLVGTFLSYVVFAFILATPFIGYIMYKWLLDFTYRMTLSPWIFITAGGICLFISFITVYGQSYKAANANPVDSIKTE